MMLMIETRTAIKVEERKSYYLAKIGYLVLFESRNVPDLFKALVLG